MPANRLSPRARSLANDGPVGGPRFVGEGPAGLGGWWRVPLGPDGGPAETGDDTCSVGG